MRLTWQGVLCISAQLFVSLPLRLCLRTCVFVAAVCEGAPPALPSNNWPATCTGAAIGTTCQGVCDTAVGTVAPVATCTSKQTGWVVVSGSCVQARCSGPLPVVQNAVWDPTCTANSGSPVGECAGGQLEQPACVPLGLGLKHTLLYCACLAACMCACLASCMMPTHQLLMERLRPGTHTDTLLFGSPSCCTSLGRGSGAHTLPLCH